MFLRIRARREDRLYCRGRPG